MVRAARAARAARVARAARAARAAGEGEAGEAGAAGEAGEAGEAGAAGVLSLDLEENRVLVVLIPQELDSTIYLRRGGAPIVLIPPRPNLFQVPALTSQS